jgi:L-cystine uptake protein TcyP (sodium:dicarboxylate symporter family)
MALKKKRLSKNAKSKAGIEDAESKTVNESVAKPKRLNLGYTKWLGLIVIGLCVEVILYAEIYLWHFTNLQCISDISSLYILIVSVVGAVITAVAAIAFKSKAENTEGGIVYETAMRELEYQYEPSSATTDDDSSDNDTGGCG